MTEKSPHNQTGQTPPEWGDDELIGLVRARDNLFPREARADYRTSFCVSMYSRGIITKSDLAFLSYVFGLGIRV